jgi:hypothetical protein
MLQTCPASQLPPAGASPVSAVQLDVEVAGWQFWQESVGFGSVAT